MNYLDMKFNNNDEFVKDKFKNSIKIIDEAFDKEIELFEMISWTLDEAMQATNYTTQISLSGFFKSLLSIYSAYGLNIKGQYGSSRILLRHAFEYLLIAKYSAVSNNSTIIEKWENGENVVIGRDIFHKLNSPDSERFRTLWKILCKYTHATIYSQQNEFNAVNNVAEINTNFAFIRALLEMNYHLFNRHCINSSMKFYFDDYASEEEKNRFKVLKKEIRTLFSVSKRTMADETKKVIRDYVSSWEIK